MNILTGIVNGCLGFLCCTRIDTLFCVVNFTLSEGAKMIVNKDW